MAIYKVINKRIVSPDGRVISEAKSVAKASGDDGTQVSQSVSVNVSSSSNSSNSSSSSSSSSKS